MRINKCVFILSLIAVVSISGCLHDGTQEPDIDPVEKDNIEDDNVPEVENDRNKEKDRKVIDSDLYEKQPFLSQIFKNHNSQEYESFSYIYNISQNNQNVKIKGDVDFQSNVLKLESSMKNSVSYYDMSENVILIDEGGTITESNVSSKEIEKFYDPTVFVMDNFDLPSKDMLMSYKGTSGGFEKFYYTSGESSIEVKIDKNHFIRRIDIKTTNVEFTSTMDNKNSIIVNFPEGDNNE